MKIKTNGLVGPALNWAVATCVNPDHGMVRTHQDNRNNWHVTLHGECSIYAPSTNWAQGGPIIEREGVSLLYQGGDGYDAYRSSIPQRSYRGATPLTAAMRCFVASKLGDEVEIPEELS